MGRIEFHLLLVGLVGSAVAVALDPHLGVRTSGATAPPIPDQLHPQRCPDDYRDHPLILVSMDGFRADFLDRGLTPTIARLAKRGVHAPYMKPSYPSITFPNHYTIATGLLPAAHGIVANRFTDPVFNATFAPGKPTSYQKRFWGGEPIWETVENQGQLSATYFWPGSEVTGHTPTYWFPFSELTPFNVRVNQVLAWLDLPREQRPRFLTLYLHEPDQKAHDFGPDSKQVDEVLQMVDDAIRQLVLGLQRRHLQDCVNLLVIADHGVTASGPDRVLHMNEIDPNFINKVTSSWNGVFSRFNSKDRSFEGTVSLMEDLNCKRKEMSVYHKLHSPARWHFGGQRRIEDIFLDLTKGYQVDVDGTYKADLGDHGYDNYIADMNALFLAYGPAFKNGLEVEAFQNIELYNLMCLLTDSTPAPNNGTWGSLHHLLVDPPPMPPSRDEVIIAPVALLPEDAAEELEELSEESECRALPDSKQRRTFIDRLTRTKAVGLSPLSFWHAPWGLPLVTIEDLPGVLTLLDTTHVAAYSRSLRTPLWATFYVHDDVQKDEGLSNLDTPSWLPDPRLHPLDLPPVCATQALVGASHAVWEPLFPSRWTSDEEDLNVESTTNAVLMTQSMKKIWTHLFNTIEIWRKKFGPMNIVVGPAFDGDGDSIKDDLANWRVQGQGVAVPTHLFAVITRCHIGFGGLHSCPPHHIDTLAFILPQYQPVSNCMSGDEFLREHSAKVKDVELITGLEFYSSLPPEDRIRLQVRIHSDIWGKETWPNRLHSQLFGLKRR
ncbi:DNA/RNA non-specific endonuclease [Trinorchestia longiramus]|nr:DNA/RNA non-specific endonuclease [Trinorchestia longiramus]